MIIQSQRRLLPLMVQCSDGWRLVCTTRQESGIGKCYMWLPNVFFVDTLREHSPSPLVYHISLYISPSSQCEIGSTFYTATNHEVKPALSIFQAKMISSHPNSTTSTANPKPRLGRTSPDTTPNPPTTPSGGSQKSPNPDTFPSHHLQTYLDQHDPYQAFLCRANSHQPDHRTRPNATATYLTDWEADWARLSAAGKSRKDKGILPHPLFCRKRSFDISADKTTKMLG